MALGLREDNHAPGDEPNVTRLSGGHCKLLLELTVRIGRSCPVDDAALIVPSMKVLPTIAKW